MKTINYIAYKGFQIKINDSRQDNGQKINNLGK
jgi:hypothetical protein